MSITKSQEYESNIKSKRLFGGLKEEAQQIEKQVEALLVTGNAMRNTISRALLGIAQIEALYVDQTEQRRKADAEVYTLQMQLAELKLHIAPAIARFEAEGVKINSIMAAADRTATDRFIPPEPMGMIENVTYVDMQYICDQLKTDRKSVRRYIEQGRLRGPDSQETETGGKPKDVWIKGLVDQSIGQFQQERKKRAA